jgi:hypothetical protein
MEMLVKSVSNTIVAAPDGTLDRVWAGLLTPTHWAEISSPGARTLAAGPDSRVRLFAHCPWNRRGS